MIPGVAAIALLLASAQQGTAARDTVAVAAAPGSSPEAAIPVESIAEEYRYLRDRGLRLVSQSLVRGARGRFFDVMKVRQRDTDATQEIWFDISDIYGIDDR